MTPTDNDSISVPNGIDLPIGVTLERGEGDLPVLRIDGEDARGEIYLHGAHVTGWQPAQASSPALWLSPSSAFETGSPIRGGIPVCFPWFSAGPDGDLSPMHGAARLVTWQLVEVEQSGDGIAVTLRVSDEDARDQLGAEIADAGPRPFVLTSRVTFGRHLGIELTAQNPGQEELRLEEALHTYFSVGHVGEVRVEGLDGASYFDKMAGEDREQDGDVTVSEPTDRVYDSSADLALHDTGLNRTVTIETESSDSTIVWNPFRDQPNLTDLPEGAWPEFVCVESANVGAHALTIAPGQSHTMRVRYDLETGA